MPSKGGKRFAINKSPTLRSISKIDKLAMFPQEHLPQGPSRGQYANTLQSHLVDNNAASKDGKGSVLTAPDGYRRGTSETRASHFKVAVDGSTPWSLSKTRAYDKSYGSKPAPTPVSTKRGY
jgi:hypothetical protein